MNIQIPKDLPGMPDYYEVTIHYKTGRQESIKTIEHSIREDILTLIGHDDQWRLIRWSAVEGLKFDESWSKIVELRNKYIEKQQAANAKSEV